MQGDFCAQLRTINLQGFITFGSFQNFKKYKLYNIYTWL